MGPMEWRKLIVGNTKIYSVRLIKFDLLAGYALTWVMTISPENSADRTAIRFPGWKEALARADLAAETKERHRRAILTLLKVCKERHAPVSVALIRDHLAVAANAAARPALVWFFHAARRAAAEREWSAAVEEAGKKRKGGKGEDGKMGAYYEAYVEERDGLGREEFLKSGAGRKHLKPKSDS